MEDLEAAWDEAALRHDRALEQLDADPAAAEVLAREAALQLGAILGPEHPDAANARTTVGQAVLRQGRIATAVALLSESASALDAWRAEPIAIPAWVRGRIILGDALRQQGFYAKAVDLLSETLDVAEKALSEDHHLRAEAWNTAGIAFRFAGEYPRAEAAYMAAVAWYERHRPEDEAAQADLHHNLSGLAHARGDYRRAEEEARAAIELRQRILVQDSEAGLGLDLAALASALEGQGRVVEALQHYEQARAICNATLPPEHPERAYLLHNEADALFEAGRHAEATALYRECLDLKERLLGPEHPELAVSLGNLASALLASGDRRGAKKTIEHALAIAGAALPEAHPWRKALAASAQEIEASG